MRDYILEDKDRITFNSTTKGTQDKYYKDGYWYKVDKNGREGLVEYLVSLTLWNSTLDESKYVKYEMCTINGKSGCRSSSFLKEDESLVTFNNLFSMLTGKEDLSNKLYAFREPKDRLMLIKSLSSTVGLKTEEYLKVILYLDLLILNPDRHMHNIAIIKTKDGYRESLIFDNGMSLCTSDSPSVGATISGSFEQQVIVFGYPLESPFKIYYEELLVSLKSVEERNGKCKEIDTLRNQLKLYENIFKY